MINPNLLARLWASRVHDSVRDMLPRTGWEYDSQGGVVHDSTVWEYPYNGVAGTRWYLYPDGTAQCEEFWNSSYWNGWVIRPSGRREFYGDNPCVQ